MTPTKDQINQWWKKIVEGSNGKTLVYVTSDEFPLIDYANVWTTSYEYKLTPKVKWALPTLPGYDFRLILRIYAWLFLDQNLKLSVGWVREFYYDRKPGGVKTDDLVRSGPEPPDWVPALFL